jgi:hypothetical protein
MAYTVGVTIPAGGTIELIVIRPTMCGSGGAGTADFTGTIYVTAIV